MEGKCVGLLKAEAGDAFTHTVFSSVIQKTLSYDSDLGAITSKKTMLCYAQEESMHS
jgi:hypothetical protein